MRLAIVMAFVTVLPFTCAAQQSLGWFQNTLDSQTYEVRQRGDLGLDLYDSNGAIIASLNKKKPTDRAFKGETHRLATACPSSTGKVEVLSVSPGRIQARVETPTVLNYQPTCDLPFMNHWTTFDLIRENAAPAQHPSTPSTAPAATPDAAIHAADRNGIHFEIDHCDREGSRVNCTVDVTNTTQDDRKFIAPTWTGSFKRINAITDSGNQLIPSVSQLGNVDTNWTPSPAIVIPGLKMPLHLVFENTTRELNEIRRLTIPMALPQNEWAEAILTGIPVVDADARQSAAPGSTAPQLVKRGGSTYRLAGCRRIKGDVLCTVNVDNAPPQNTVKWNAFRSYVIDAVGNRATATEISIDGARDGDFQAGEQGRIDVRFSGVPAQVTQLGRVALTGTDSAGFTVEFGDVPIK